ncbi:hypothetical protein V8J88_11910 [Massilia sp. W12]|uniref:hypothetical protein n=1 Tax=Massilia sp. W12 TaxID=3126507 RepID=UPI0030CC609B
MEISSSIVNLQPGLYVLRHPKTEGVSLSVTRGPNCLAQIEMLATPNTHGSLLRNGADCIVMLIQHAPAELLVTAISATPLTNSVELRVDRIGLDAGGAAALPQAAPGAPAASTLTSPPRPIEIGPHGISIIGHIEREGDVVAAEGQILGKPDDGLRLEGFQLMWPDKPEGVDLAYNVSIEGYGATPVVHTGGFCGTRGEARRITEVTFTLIGPQASAYQLDGMATFSGGFQVPVESGMPLGGPSGMEHLTAICLKTVAAGAKRNPWNDTAKTRVYRGKAAREGVTEAKESKKAGSRSAKSRQA